MRCGIPGLRQVVVLLLVLAGVGLRAAAGPGVKASSIHSRKYPAKYAVDGNRKTRWASGTFNDGLSEWLELDLGKVTPVENITIHWETAHAVDYQIQVSDDAAKWRMLCDKKNSRGGKQVIAGLSGKGRYVRIFCTKPGQWNIVSIWEVEFPDAKVARQYAAARRKAAVAQAKAAVEAHKSATQRLGELGVGEIVFAAREPSVDGHWYANFGYFAPDRNRKCYRRMGRLCKLDVATGKVKMLIDDQEGSVRDPVVHYDAKKICFSWRKAGTEQFHLYEIGVDGRGLKQLTGGIHNDIEPTYLPDGGIMFISSRAKRWVNCWLTQVAVLYRCDANGKNIRQISANVEQDNTPWVLPDGRIIYQRWEYVDRSQVHYHHLWSTNPDGTGQMIYFGNQRPGAVFIDAKPIPGTNEVLLINSPGHGAREHGGHVAIVSSDTGPDEPSAMRSITRGRGYRDPWALTANAFIVAHGKKMVLLDRRGASSDIYSLTSDFGRGTDLHEPRPVIRRPRERVIPSRVNLNQPTGRLAVMDVYKGRNMKGVQRGEIKKLLLVESLPKPINFTGGMEPLTYGGSFTLERVIGTVPVEADGSAYMELPANRAMFFVALDASDSSVKRMQSFLTVMPGETTSCVGCHEQRKNIAGYADGFRQASAMNRPPSRPEPVAGVPDVFSYPRDIQPIFDKYCLKCHDVDKRKGGVLLTGDRGPMFSHSYFMLTARQQVSDGRNRPVSNYPPRGIGDSASLLMKKLDGSHHDVKVAPADVKMVRYWIHTGAAYIGTYAGLGCGMIGGYAQNRIDRQDTTWPSMKAAMGVLQKRCGKCHGGRSKRLPTSPSDNMGMPPWAIRYGDPLLTYSRHILYNLTRPAKSLQLLAPLARQAGGYGMVKRGKDGKPVGQPVEVFKDTADADYKVLLAAIVATKKRLDEIKRFDMPGFKPRPQYIREMKKYGILPESFDLAKDPVNAYEFDRKYWQSLWYYPPGAKRPALHDNSAAHSKP